ncbi:MAG: hypothetical protein JJE15_02080 [Desulfobacteraceae bacterium]|nr:hypothetical protein [Desulfobacteraceae bacterium]
MNINCHQYRKEMELINLRRRLEKGISDPKERKAIEKKVSALERDLKLN